MVQHFGTPDTGLNDPWEDHPRNVVQMTYLTRDASSKGHIMQEQTFRDTSSKVVGTKTLQTHTSLSCQNVLRFNFLSMRSSGSGSEQIYRFHSDGRCFIMFGIERRTVAEFALILQPKIDDFIDSPFILYVLKVALFEFLQ
jgi:hypothetical protein